MWDNAPLLRSIANTLFMCSVLALFYGAVNYVVHRPEILPIKRVSLANVPERVVADDVLATVRKRAQGNFLTVDIASLRRSLETLPWVRSVSVRRVFPDQLRVNLEEHVALAYWNDDALVNQQGEVFAGQTTQTLPQFVGNDGTADEVSTEYRKFNEQLKPINLQLKKLVLSPRHSWQLHLSNDMIVELGRESMQKRLARFVAVYPYSLVQYGASAQEIQVVDMRYRDGFAVKKHHGSA